MASSRLLFSLCLVFVKVLALAKAQQPADQPVMSYHECVGKGNYTTNSTYQTNLNQLLTSIYTNTEINNGFYNFSNGQDADTVYSIALCRPDISPGACRSCITNASDSLVRLCPNFVEAIGGLDDCMVRYTNRSIFNLLEGGPYFWVYDHRVNVSDVVRFNQSRMTLLDRLRDEAAAGDSRYKYEIDRFYDPSSNSIPPPPDSTSNNSIPSPPASTSQGKKGLKRNAIIIISIVPIAVSVILIVCVCIFLRARRKQKGEEEEEAEDLNEMEGVELLQLDFGTVRAATASLSIAQPDFLYQSCRNTENNYTANSTFQKNLDSLLSSLASNTQIDYGYYNFSAGQIGPDQVHAIALCRGDILLNECRGCVSNSVRKILQVCPNQKEAIGIYDFCILRYSNRSSFGVLDEEFIVYTWNTENASHVNLFSQALGNLTSRLRTAAASAATLAQLPLPPSPEAPPAAGRP
ncbi:hypothetical protein D5086_021259 [Populus alba]|uniref:Uncharacterized protein n=1 Tax=Populus alba TaxID=43335 RepID=A0ACC4BCH6_POPAL